MLEISIPEFGHLQLRYLVLDYNGTLGFDGKLSSEVKEKLTKLSEKLKIHVLTADTFGTARSELTDVPCEVHVIVDAEQDEQKELYVHGLGAMEVVAYGNGRNDRRMLNAAGLGIAVLGREGCAVDALQAADVCIFDIVDGLDLLLNPTRLKATLKI
ncbi:MAG: ATPase P [Candidatus Bathyarchaeota archaeon]|nr:ATPase P [Candidatus Bathyarchaeota archaeon]